MSEVEKLQLEVTELRRMIELLYNSSTIPHDVEQSFRTRFKLDTYNPITTSAKSASSENQSVNESGSSSYSVLKAPDAFLQVTLSGAVKYIPIYT